MKKVSVSFLSSKDEQKDILKIDRTSALYLLYTSHPDEIV